MLRRLAAWLVALLATFVATPERVDALDVADAEERRNLKPLHSETQLEPGHRDTQSPAVELLCSLKLNVGRIRITGGADLHRSLSRALQECRNRGDLKVQLLLRPQATVEAINEVALRSGFVFWRERRLGTEPVAEYYVDLYTIPKSTAGAA